MMESEAPYGPGQTLPPPRINPLRLELTNSALQGLLANPKWVDLKMKLAIEQAGGDTDAAASILKNELAEDAVEIADAVVAMLLKDSEP